MLKALRGPLNRWGNFFGVDHTPSQGLREALQWLMMARLGVLYVVLSVVVLHQVIRTPGLGSHGLVLAYALLAVSFAFNFFHAMLAERMPPSWWIAGSHIVFDAVITSAWIGFSGSQNLFALLYLVQILINALVLYQRGALVASTVACLGFAVVSWLQPQPTQVLTWIVYSVLFLTLGVVGGYLSEELLRTTESLKDKSRKMEQLIDLHERILSDLPTGLLAVDDTMRISFVNPAAEQILGHPGESLVGRPLQEAEPALMPFFDQIDGETLKEEEDDAALDEPGRETQLSATGTQHHRSFFVRAKSGKGTARLQQTVEVGRGSRTRVLRGDVADLHAEAGVSPLVRALSEGSTGNGVGGRVLLFQDVTKLVHLEEKLKQHEKLAAVGQLAAGIAHEIRNPLASMSASIEMLKDAFPEASATGENRRLMEIAIREIDRLNRLITEFLDFVKPEKFKLAAVDLGALLGDVVLAVRGSKEARDRVAFLEEYTAASALANGEKLKQVIYNLVVNAVQSMTKGGEVRVGCGPVSAQRVKFWVEDQGHGMSEDVLSHLYEPFFTTKDKGTGLGLATAYKIVEAHHGEIRVTSRVGTGTRFEIWLPAA